VIHTSRLKVKVLIVLHLLILVQLQVLGNLRNVRKQVVIDVGLVVTLFHFFLLIG
jgi:hypothetical protein